MKGFIKECKPRSNYVSNQFLSSYFFLCSQSEIIVLIVEIQSQAIEICANVNVTMLFKHMNKGWVTCSLQSE